ncbi:2'-5' RNA ligase family protein [Clostridium ganghwense]|uniref:2'-5' RNA ligase family protein n=1 Tax=Clostridium ganghwense TaxID=312089 RepID=A0ABT4CQD1_9CLOT|nr:2'-5' RNA ligase family protein [Clostridium ganghwense]MCY6370291.1 2'-5' RNA ligase family protein [Clostridium ganghwense]
MVYYLVGLLDKTSYKYIEKIQKDLSDKFNLYTELPVLHVTLEVINEPDIEKLTFWLDNLLKKYSKFTININGVICFDPPFKSVNLKVEKDIHIMNLIENINSVLKAEGFKVRENIDDWDLHISLANSYFSKRDWSAEEFQAACLLTKKKYFKKQSKITEIQLWKPINDKNSMVVKSFTLKNSTEK